MTAPNETEQHQQFRELPKRRLYELYWEDERSFSDIADEYNVPRKFVMKVYRKRGIPYPSRSSRQAYFFSQRSRRYYYHLYWTEDMTFSEMAERFGVSESVVKDRFNQANVATMEQYENQKWYDKGRGIPQRYKLPRDEPDHNQSLPDDPDAERYLLEETPLQFDKDRLYELHWKYGCSMAHIGAMMDNNKPREVFRRHGIPYRNYQQHRDWEPHHSTVPPMFQWPRNSEQQRQKDGLEDGVKMNWGREKAPIGD